MSNDSTADEGTADERPGGFKPPTKDPWKSFRGVCAGLLILEAIVVLLALPGIGALSVGLSAAGVTYLVVLALLMILGAGVQGRSWAMGYNLALQVALIAGFAVHIAIGALGLLFAALWVYLLYLRRDILDRMEQGLLPGQRD
ncbi:DUF4233 domain-containing protein [Rhodococcus kronopolitis]|uniref:DUF4233 domain-containing protein n=1 Tax=Rhodococcus kronopolitis TaxID=1460226 RepID=A0ABV9FMD5_9NOCA